MNTPKLTRFVRTCQCDNVGVILVHTHLMCAHCMAAYVPGTTDFYVTGSPAMFHQLSLAPSIYLYNHGPSLQVSGVG